ncbi:MAG: ROK family protein [Eubacteriales bacterium]
MSICVGFDIGGTKCAVSLGEEKDGALRVLDKRRFPTKSAPSVMLGALTDAAAEMLRAAGNPDVRAAGISSGGPLSSAQGMILSPPNLPGWDEVPAADFITERLGVPAYLENDANACAVAEWRYGAGRGTRNMVFLTFGTGLGAGLILDGRLYRGASDAAGEIGHVRLTPAGPSGFGKAGSCEGWCSGGGIARLGLQMAREDKAGASALLSRAGGEDGVTAALIAALAVEGDLFCRRVYETSGAMLGRTLAILSDLLDPERIVIGSIFARSEALLRPSMEQTLRAEALRAPEIVPAALGEAIGDMAALSIAFAGDAQRDVPGRTS